MILYTLSCDADHRFESWFRDSASCDEQVAAERVSCPICRSTRVGKAIMAPALVGGHAGVPARRDEGGEVTLLDDRRKEMRARMKGLRDKILSEGRDVGVRFPEEARRMHEGETEREQIHGQATPDEARSLIEDGIMILPVPVLPEELN